MDQDINAAAIIEQLQAENERLREKIAGLVLTQHSLFGRIADWWSGMDSIDRYYVVAGAAVIVVAAANLAALFRRA